MDIFIHSSDETNAYSIRRLSTERSAGKAAGAGKRAFRADYDVVSINSRSTAMSDDDFAAAISRATAKEVGQSVPESRLAQLKAEVQSGTYKVDSMRIAEKLLGYRD
jgi:flagellar biosynthesis anti-sigma factor FlgM